MEPSGRRPDLSILLTKLAVRDSRRYLRSIKKEGLPGWLEDDLKSEAYKVMVETEIKRSLSSLRERR